MSPYCPKCFGIAAKNELRCPLDQHFLHSRACSQCHQEMLPRESYCANCGTSAKSAHERLLVPPDAGPGRQLAAVLFDYLCIFVLSYVMLSDFHPFWVLAAVPGVGVVYRALARSGARQSLGQTVFSLATLASDAGPASFVCAFKRSLYELLLLPILFVGQRKSASTLEELTATLEVKLA